MIVLTLVFRRAVASLLYGLHTILHGDVAGQLHVCGVGCEVHGRFHPGQRVQLLLDPGRARCAGHAFQVQIHGTHSRVNGTTPGGYSPYALRTNNPSTAANDSTDRGS